MRPVVGRSRPPSRASRVDFPQPEGPVMATNSPGATSKETPSSAVTATSPDLKTRPTLSTRSPIGWPSRSQASPPRGEAAGTGRRGATSASGSWVGVVGTDAPDRAGTGLGGAGAPGRRPGPGGSGGRGAGGRGSPVPAGTAPGRDPDGGRPSPPGSGSPLAGDGRPARGAAAGGDPEARGAGGATDRGSAPGPGAAGGRGGTPPPGPGRAAGAAGAGPAGAGGGFGGPYGGVRPGPGAAAPVRGAGKGGGAPTAGEGGEAGEVSPGRPAAPCAGAVVGPDGGAGVGLGPVVGTGRAGGLGGAAGGPGGCEGEGAAGGAGARVGAVSGDALVPPEVPTSGSRRASPLSSASGVAEASSRGVSSGVLRGPDLVDALLRKSPSGGPERVQPGHRAGERDPTQQDASDHVRLPVHVEIDTIQSHDPNHRHHRRPCCASHPFPRPQPSDQVRPTTIDQDRAHDVTTGIAPTQCQRGGGENRYETWSIVVREPDRGRVDDGALVDHLEGQGQGQRQQGPGGPAPAGGDQEQDHGQGQGRGHLRPAQDGHRRRRRPHPRPPPGGRQTRHLQVDPVQQAERHGLRVGDEGQAARPHRHQRPAQRPGHRWHLGQKTVLRPANRIAVSRRPQRTQGQPARP